MSVLTDSEIFKGLQNGSIVISDFCKEQLNNTSYNVRLGNFHWVQNRLYLDGTEGVDPFSENCQIWDKCKSGAIFLDPGEIALCHTEEFIGSRSGCVPEMRARSTMMRAGLSVAPSAGWGDVGYHNRWTFTIANHGKRSIILHPGCQVAQIVFHRVSEPEKLYDGSYQQSLDISKLIETWSPDVMLPKNHRKIETPASVTRKSINPV